VGSPRRQDTEEFALHPTLTGNNLCRGKRLVAAFVSTVLVLSGFLLGSAAPAVALTGRTLVTATSVSNSVNKSITAHCPAGKQVVGAGGAILNSIGAHGGYGHVVITDIIPNHALTSVTVQGGENSAWASPWKVVAYAMCAPVGAIANLQRVTATAANNGTSDAVKTATAHCPGNLRLYGTGFEINNANGSVLLDKLQPDPGLTEVAGKAVNNGPAGAFAQKYTVLHNVLSDKRLYDQKTASKSTDCLAQELL
jgi:hypothetical protein